MTTNNAKASALPDPIESMIDTMRHAGIDAFQDPQKWETCLCAAALALEPKCKTYRFMESLPQGRERYTEKDMIDALAHLGYFSRPIETDISGIDLRLLPALFLASGHEPMILISEDDGRIKTYRNGNVLYLEKNQLPRGNGKAYLFERYDQSRPAFSRFVREGTRYSWFRALFGRFRKNFIQILSAGLILNLISLITPLFIMLIYDRVISTGTIEILPMILAGMGIAIVCEFALRQARSYGLSWIAARLDNIVGNQIFAHLVGLPPHMIERASVASQVARIRTFESIRDFFCGSVFLSIIELPFVALAALAIYIIAGPLVLVPLGFCVLYGLLFHVLYKKVITSIRLAAKGSSAKQQFTIETFEKMTGIRSYGLADVWAAKYRDLSGKETMAHFRLAWIGMLGETLSHALTLLAAVCTIGYGAHLIWAGQIGTGALVASMILVWRILTPFYSVCTIIPRLEQIRKSILQVNDLMDTETEEQGSTAFSRLPHLRGDIEFKNVSLRYAEQGDPVMSDLTFHCAAGDILAITGENGAGKSSILKMIKGLYSPLGGSILIDGFDLRQLDPVYLRRQIAYAPQNFDFFDGSILDNLRLSNPLATMDEIIEASELATAHNDIMNMPQRYNACLNRYVADTLPSDLSAKLALARLYLHRSPIMLIDELPNTLMSGKAGKNLRDYLAFGKGKRTCLIVSYRDDILRMADMVVLMRSGKTPLCGKPEILLKTMTEAA